LKLNWFDRITMPLAPKWTLARMKARHYEAAQATRRTSGWHRNTGDANATTSRSIIELRLHARDLCRNNAHAKKAQHVIANNVAGWGLVPKADGPDREQNVIATAKWKAWAGSTECDSEGGMKFAGIQHLTMKSVVESGEILIRRRFRRPEDGLAIPLQLQMLESDFIDSGKDGMKGPAGGQIIQGVEFDMIGRRVAYWLFEAHPGSGLLTTGQSKRVPAAEIIHVFHKLRPGQVRGVSWFAPVIVPLKDFDEFEDGTLMRQKVAAMFAAFVTDTDGTGSAIGEQDESDPLIESFEPGMVVQLPDGKSVTFANPPATPDDKFTERTLRRIAAGLGVTYEDLTGDYSQSNFSSARMARLSHWGNVHDWRENMLIPLLCDQVWRWAMEAAAIAGMISEPMPADWTAPPMPMIEPDKEGLAYSRLVRNGTMTYSQMIREQGGDPEAHLDEYQADQKMLDDRKIQLDSDVRAVSAAGLTQVRVGLGGGKPTGEKDEADRAADEFLERTILELEADS
jgi:lambda family phage portal protein